MKNVAIKVEGTKLKIEVDLTKEFGLSGSQKTKVIATTSGMTHVDIGKGEDILVGLNVNRKVKES